MPLFRYKARDNNGDLHIGQQEALHKSQIASRLMDERLIPITIDEITPSINLEDVFKNLLPKPKIGLDDLVLFCRQMHALSKSGIPIMRAVYGLSDSTKNPILKQVLHDVGNVLSRGNTLSHALKSHERYFNPIFISMIHVGESTGNLDQAFFQLVHYLEMIRDTRKKITSALRYPLMVITAIIVAVFVVNLFVIPSFAGVFEKFGKELPLATSLLLTTSNFFIHFWWLLLFLFASGVIAFFRWTRKRKGATQWDQLKLNIPIIGSLINRICLSRFTRTFSMLSSAGVPILQALDVSAESIGNLHIEQNVKDMRAGIERGESLSRTANASGMFTPLILQMIAVGEESGALDSLLNDASDFYDEETDFEIKQLSSAIEPIILVIMGFMILILALGIFLPLWDLSATPR